MNAKQALPEVLAQAVAVEPSFRLALCRQSKHRVNVLLSLRKRKWEGEDRFSESGECSWIIES